MHIFVVFYIQICAIQLFDCISNRKTHVKQLTVVVFPFIYSFTFMFSFYMYVYFMFIYMDIIIVWGQ